MSAKPSFDEIAKLEEEIHASQVPEDLAADLLGKLTRLAKLSTSAGFFAEIERTANYIEWVTSLPWAKRTEDILDLNFAKQTLDRNHYGLIQIKERILEYLSVLKLKKEGGASDVMRAPILCFVGLVGTGKTTIGFSIAQAMGRKFARIPFGGMGDPLELRGQSRIHADAEPGQVIKALRKVGAKNPVILLDEIDRVAEEGRSGVMGVLIELLDPEQNEAFVDHYVDYPFNLSEVLFITTANNTTNISTAVLDRIEPIAMPTYTDEEKIAIGRDFVFPRTAKEAGIPQGVLSIDDSVWPQIVRPLGYDAGIRTLERTINGIVRKVAKEIVEGKGKTFYLTQENIKDYLPQW